MMIGIAVMIVAQVAGASSAATPLERLRAKVPVEAVVNAAVAQLAGRYTTTSKELGKLVGPFLDGDDLYLFPDRTYIYTEWSDISPLTVMDKGTWALASGLVQLKSDADVTRDPGKYRRYERKYAAVRRSSQNAVLLVGVDRELPYFEEKAGERPGFMLLVVAMKRETTYSKSAAARVKARLLRQAWRPEFFQEPTK